MSENKKAAEAEEHGESAPLWIISFADLVTLTLSFFVILAAGAPKKADKDPEFAGVAAGVKMAFDYVPAEDSTDPIDVIVRKLRSGHGDYPKDGDVSERTEGVVGRNDLVKTIRTGTQITLGGPIPFAKDSAELSPEAAKTVAHIAGLIKGHANVFLVKGHASRDEELQEGGARRDLGYQRAQVVAAKLAEAGVPKDALRVQSCRDYEPIKEGVYTDDGRAVNRRVEVYSTEAFVNEFRDPSVATQPRSSPSASHDVPQGH